jgi:ABC-type branched-subunit amino acid transport system permease subunit
MGFRPGLAYFVDSSNRAIAYLIGKPIFRFRGHMLVIVTSAIGLIFWGLFEMDFITGGMKASAGFLGCLSVVLRSPRYSLLLSRSSHICLALHRHFQYYQVKDRD